MTASTTPIFIAIPDLSTNDSPSSGGSVGASMTTAANDYTGVSTSYVLEHTAGANGSYVERLRFKAVGTNVATVARIFINNGGSQTTATNNFFYDDIALPATNSSSTTQTGPSIDLQMNLRLPPSWRIYVGLATTVAAGWGCIAIAGQY